MEQPLRKGNSLPDSYRQLVDEQTGAHIHQLTDSWSINHSLFFLNPSFRPGSSDQVAFVTHRDGYPQLCLFDFDSQTARALTDRGDIQPFSACFSPDGRSLYFTTKSAEVWALDIETLTESRLSSLPGSSLGECNASVDGRFLVTACERDSNFGVFLVDIGNRSSRVVLEKGLRVIHPQFHPLGSNLIEYAGDPAPRLWLVHRDGTGDTCLYENASSEFVVHESFLGRGDDLIFTIWPYRLCRLNIHRRKIETIADINAWHMVSSRDGRRIVSDSNHPDRGLLLIDPQTGNFETICHPDASCQGSQWEQGYPAGPEVWRAIKEKKGKRASWMEMKTDRVYGPQWTHPHPAFDDSGMRIVYTSDRSGYPQVYVVDSPSRLM